MHAERKSGFHPPGHSMGPEGSPEFCGTPGLKNTGLKTGVGAEIQRVIAEFPKGGAPKASRSHMVSVFLTS